METFELEDGDFWLETPGWKIEKSKFQSCTIVLRSRIEFYSDVQESNFLTATYFPGVSSQVP